MIIHSYDHSFIHSIHLLQYYINNTMNLNCPNDVLNYPITKKELAHSSRSRIGYHVFLSHFFFDFYSLSGTEKGDVLATSQVWEDADAQSCYSVLTPRTPAVCEVMQAASWHWRSMFLRLKNSWGVRATQLNRRLRNAQNCHLQRSICWRRDWLWNIVSQINYVVIYYVLIYSLNSELTTT